MQLTRHRLLESLICRQLKYVVGCIYMYVVCNLIIFFKVVVELRKLPNRSLGFSIAGGKGSTPAYEDVDEVGVAIIKRGYTLYVFIIVIF